MEPGTAVFGYIVCESLPDGSQLGGVLITDIYGLPVEFRHTDPVLPSKLQRVLYGRSLDSYIANEVLVSALLSAVIAKPQLYVCGDSGYVDGSGEFGPPAAFVSESRTAQDKEVGHRHDIAANEFILQLGPGNGAVRVKVGTPRGVSNPDSIKNAADLSARLLLQAGQSMEVLEPLERVSEAIQMLWDDIQAKNHSARAHSRKAA